MQFAGFVAVHRLRRIEGHQPNERGRRPFYVGLFAVLVSVLLRVNGVSQRLFGG